MSAIDTVLGALEATQCAPRRSARGYSSRCPACERRSQTLSLAETSDGRVLLYCHAGCDYRLVLGRLGLEPRDLFRDESDRRWGR